MANAIVEMQMDMLINIGAIGMLSFGIWLLYTISGSVKPDTDEHMSQDGS